jgi:hypothetical protein
MKHAFIIILLSIGYISFAQQPEDTTIQKKTADSLKTVKYRLKDANQKFLYRKRVLSELRDIDTLRTDINSVVFNYISKDDQLLQKTILKFARMDCISSELIEYFNKKGLLEYFEQWNYDCRTEEEISPGDKPFERLLYHFERFEYDSLNRVTLRVFYYPTIPYSRQIKYSYDSKGNQQAQIKVIAENEFWDSDGPPTDSADEKRRAVE